MSALDEAKAGTFTAPNTNETRIAVLMVLGYTLQKAAFGTKRG